MAFYNQCPFVRIIVKCFNKWHFNLNKAFLFPPTVTVKTLMFPVLSSLLCVFLFVWTRCAHIWHAGWSWKHRACCCPAPMDKEGRNCHMSRAGARSSDPVFITPVKGIQTGFNKKKYHSTIRKHDLSWTWQEMKDLATRKKEKTFKRWYILCFCSDRSFSQSCSLTWTDYKKASGKSFKTNQQQVLILPA